jgi:hypothetical protein
MPNFSCAYFRPWCLQLIGGWCTGNAVVGSALSLSFPFPTRHRWERWCMVVVHGDAIASLCSTRSTLRRLLGHD